MHWRKTLVEKWNWLNCLQQVCAEEGSALISLPLLWGVERKALQSMKSKTLHGKRSLWTISLQIRVLEWDRMSETPKKSLRQSEGMNLEESVSKKATKSCEYKNKLVGTEDTPLSGPEIKDWEWQSWKIVPSQSLPSRQESFLLHHY